MRALISILLLLGLPYNSICQPATDSLLAVLKTEMRKKSSYDKIKENRIAALKERLLGISSTDFSQQYQICDQIFDEYKDFKFDSAYVYAQKLLRIGILTGDLTKQYESIIKLGSIQLSGGMFKETFDCIRKININLVNDTVKLKYYGLKSRALKDLAAYNSNAFYSPANNALSMAILDSALLLTKRGSYDHYKKVAERLALSGKSKEAADILRKLLIQPKYNDHQRAMAANDLSNLIGGNEKKKLITLAAIYDIRTSTKQTLASFTLGKALFKAGNIDDAILLLSEAYSQAVFYGNKPREREVTAILTQASAQNLINSENRKNHLLTILIIVALVTLTGLAFISFMVYNKLKQVKVRERLVNKQNQQLDDINKRLLEDGHIKEEYIGYFFKIISSYILKIEKIKRNTERKLKGGNYEELLKLAREIDIKAERENLFYTFDKIFLKLFPNFISTFNSLLNPEDQIWPKANEVLNTNLRIFALIRLGIKDSQTIANILETSISTIYTYRNRVKSKALVLGEDFETQIMKIKFADIK